LKHTVYWIEGDGIGPEISAVMRPVIDAAINICSNGTENIEWIELLAGEKAVRLTGSALPEQTIRTLRSAKVAIKGPLCTPVGGGIRSLNVTLRKSLDLYACIRPIRWVEGVAAPVLHPERVNMVIFRENLEDVYAGIEFEAGTTEAETLRKMLQDQLGTHIRKHSAIGIKPMSEFNSKRLVRRAIRYALENALPSVTIVHKGNIMKYTEGGFRAWGYEVASEEFGEVTIPEKLATPENSVGKVIIKDRIADAMFQEALLHPEEYSVLALPNLNGDFMSDALAAQVGGLGLAPGVNMSDSLAFFEATHGTAPSITGKDIANPGSLILSGALMLDHLHFKKAGNLIRRSIASMIAQRTVTADLSSEISGAQILSCREFGQKLISTMRSCSA